MSKVNKQRSATASPLHNVEPVQLVPASPPGRRTRKALSFAPQMRDLRAQGYTFEAIRQALAAAGVHVSNATVQREIARVVKPTARAPSVPTPPRAARLTLMPAGDTPAVLPAADPLPSTGKPAQSSFAGGPRGEDVAKAFMSTQITNPFMRKKEKR